MTRHVFALLPLTAGLLWHLFLLIAVLILPPSVEDTPQVKHDFKISRNLRHTENRKVTVDNDTPPEESKQLTPLPEHECVDRERVDVAWTRETCVTARMLNDMSDVSFYQSCGAEATIFRATRFSPFHVTEGESLKDTCENVASTLPMLVASCLMFTALHEFFAAQKPAGAPAESQLDGATTDHAYEALTGGDVEVESSEQDRMGGLETDPTQTIASCCHCRGTGTAEYGECVWCGGAGKEEDTLVKLERFGELRWSDNFSAIVYWDHTEEGMFWWNNGSQMWEHGTDSLSHFQSWTSASTMEQITGKTGYPGLVASAELVSEQAPAIGDLVQITKRAYKGRFGVVLADKDDNGKFNVSVEDEFECLLARDYFCKCHAVIVWTNKGVQKWCTIPDGEGAGAFSVVDRTSARPGERVTGLQRGRWRDNFGTIDMKRAVEEGIFSEAQLLDVAEISQWREDVIRSFIKEKYCSLCTQEIEVYVVDAEGRRTSVPLDVAPWAVDVSRMVFPCMLAIAKKTHQEDAGVDAADLRGCWKVVDAAGIDYYPEWDFNTKGGRCNQGEVLRVTEVKKDGSKPYGFVLEKGWIPIGISTWKVQPHPEIFDGVWKPFQGEATSTFHISGHWLVIQQKGSDYKGDAIEITFPTPKTFKRKTGWSGTYCLQEDGNLHTEDGVWRKAVEENEGVLVKCEFVDLPEVPESEIERAPNECGKKAIAYCLRNLLLIMILINSMYIAFITSRRFIQTVSKMKSHLHFGGWCNLMLYCDYTSYADTMKVMTLASFSVADAVFVGLKLAHDLSVMSAAGCCANCLGLKHLFNLICCCKCWHVITWSSLCSFCCCPCISVVIWLMPIFSSAYNLGAIIVVCGCYSVLFFAVLYLASMVLYAALLPIGLIRKCVSKQDFAGFTSFNEHVFSNVIVHLWDDIFKKLLVKEKKTKEDDPTFQIMQEINVAARSTSNFLKWSAKSKYFVLAIPAALQVWMGYSHQASVALAHTYRHLYGDPTVYDSLLVKSGIDQPGFFDAMQKSFAATNEFLRMSFVEWPGGAYDYIHSSVESSIAYYTNATVIKRLAKQQAMDYLEENFQVHEKVEDLQKSVFFLRGFNGFWTGPMELLDRICQFTVV